MSGKSYTYKNMITRIRPQVLEQLKEIAEEETAKGGRRVYVADLVREAIKHTIDEHKKKKNSNS